MSDQNLKKMANLLQNGATMLDLYCPRCNNILFRLKNETIFCTNCNQEVRVIKDNPAQISSKMDEHIIPQEIDFGLNNPTLTYSELINFFSHLIAKWTLELKDLSDREKSEKNLIFIDKALDIIRKIREIQKL